MAPSEQAHVEITDVSPASALPDWLLEFGLTLPRLGPAPEPYAGTYAVAVEGWARSRDDAVLTLELSEGDDVLHRGPVASGRPDAAGGEAPAGFRAVVGMVGAPAEFGLAVRVSSADGRRATVAQITGRRGRLRTGLASPLAPLLVTTLARTGSSWLMLVLSAHEQIVTYRPFQFEPRVASYWMDVLGTLAQPASYVTSILPELTQGHWWIGEERPTPLPLTMADASLPRWLGRESVDATMAFCQSQVDAFYGEVARVQGTDGGRFFAEKAGPGVAQRILDELYDGGRELILVRDFRDMICSMLALNEKRGYRGFGRRRGASDEDFIRYQGERVSRLLNAWRERSDRAQLVRYEDLIREPQSTVASILSYLGLDSGPDVAAGLLTEASGALPAAQRNHPTSPSAAASIGRWRSDLPAAQRALCEEVFADALPAFGYEPAPAPRARQGPRPARLESRAAIVQAERPQPQITIVGAGGYLFPLLMIRDMLSFEALQGSAIRLYDIDAARAERTAQAARELAERHGLGPEISVIDDRGEALAGAQFVICTMQVGGLEAFRADVEIPREYGVDQTVGDTQGPGGVFRALRTIPVLRGLALQMRRRCPDALLLQYANPMAPNCWASERLRVATVGLCHSVQHTSRMLADELGVPYDEVVFDCAGVNHTAWFTTFRRGPEDLLPAIRTAMAERHLADPRSGVRGPGANAYEGGDERVRAELMRLTGYFHTESSHHASEYWPWFRTSPAATGRYFDERWDFLAESLARSDETRIEEIVHGPLAASEEYGAAVIDSIVSGTARVVYGNVVNRGLISNLPHDACVELACSVGAAGLRPLRYGPLPAACAALNNVQVNLHRVIVEAALSGDRKLVHAAVALDPLTGAVLSLPEIRELTDRLLEAESRWLPQFAEPAPPPR